MTRAVGRLRRFGLLLVGGFALLQGGCAQDGSSIVDETMGGGHDGGGLRPTLASIQANIFTPICTDCHIAGGKGPMPLDSEENSYANLVNAPSIELLMQRVVPGDPDNSYLVWKIEGRPTIVLSRMPPPPKPALSPEQIDAIVTWIERGAPR